MQDRPKDLFSRRQICAICGTEKSGTDFRWNPKTGLRTDCIECEKTVLRCSHCNQVKPHEDFPPARKYKTGRHSICRKCFASRNLDRYHNDPNYRAAHDKRQKSKRAIAWRRQYYSRPDIKERNRSRHAKHTNWLYHNDIIYRLKVKARAAVDHAIKTGKLIKPDCCQSHGKYGVSVCAGRIEAHHWHGYWPRAAWTDVEWLCTACHKAADEQTSEEFGIVFRDPENPIYAAIAKRVDLICDILGIDEEHLFAATLECAGEDECDTFLKAIDWLRINGYGITKPEPLNA